MKRPKLLNRPPPTWQNQKLVLARKMVSKLDGIEKRLDAIIVLVSVQKEKRRYGRDKYDRIS